MLRGLLALNLSRNSLSQINVIQNFSGLKELNVSSNKLGNLLPVMKLTSLSVLLASNNKLKDILPLKQCTQLTVLKLENNQLFNFEETVKTLKLLHKLSDLSVFLNPCTKKTKNYQETLSSELLSLETLDERPVTRQGTSVPQEQLTVSKTPGNSSSVDSSFKPRSLHDQQLERELRQLRQENAGLRFKLKKVWELVSCVVHQDYTDLHLLLPQLDKGLDQILEEDEDEDFN